MDHQFFDRNDCEFYYSNLCLKYDLSLFILKISNLWRIDYIPYFNQISINYFLKFWKI